MKLPVHDTKEWEKELKEYKDKTNLVLTTATLTQSAHAMTRVRAPSHHAMCGSYAPGGGLPRGLSTYAIRASRASS